MPQASPQNQTRSFLIKRFAEVGFRPRTKHGQNFLVDLNLQRLLVDSAQLSPRDVVLEVGTGTGALTELLAREAAEVITVEIDEQLFQLASEHLAMSDNVTMLKRDVLRNKNHLDREVMELLSERLAASPSGRFKLVANLPYSIATPLVTNLLVAPPLPASMTVTIQKELADRIIARPSTKDYGALSVWIQCQCHVQLIRVLPPQVFWPRPKVSSAIVHMTLDESLRARLGDVEFFHDFARAMFFHRRKFLRSVACSALKGRLSKQEVDDVLDEMGFAPDTRAEQLDVETMIRFAHAVRGRTGGGRLL